jgi:hypothetical protein
MIAGSCGLVLAGLATLVFANHKIEGTYDLQKWGFGADSESTVWITKVDDTNYEVIRESDSGILRGNAVLRSDGWLGVTFPAAAGAADHLNNLGDAAASSTGAYYYVRENGRVWAYVQTGPDQWSFEYGARGDDRDPPADDSGDDSDDSGDDPTDPNDPSDDADLAVVKPAAGAVLVGSQVALELKPADAELTVDGPAERDGDALKITGAGEITLKATSNGEESSEVKLTAITATVTGITVLDTIAISDAQAPHFVRDGDESTTTPAAIYQKTKLKLQVTLQADEDLAEAATVELAAGAAPGFAAEVELQGLSSGQQVTIESTDDLHQGVNVNALDLAWTVGGQDAGSTALRVYTTHKAPIKNIGRDQRAPNTVLHFEKACTWARGASQNIGNGSDSIAYQIDNQMRHYVHHQDLNGAEPFMTDYPEGADAPKNYDDLPGSVRNGNRSVSPLYYPPLEPDEDYEQYENYRNNFGWWVLDNPDYTGGRCNQQAALVCGILGTVGIKAEILYLHRIARGKNTGRPIRHYFYAAGGGGPWNFHGVALADMEDGSQWIYDGSFSWPPNRKNGTREWAENEGGPFIQSFATWYYDDYFGGKVPDDDIPDSSTWEGIPARN